MEKKHIEDTVLWHLRDIYDRWIKIVSNTQIKLERAERVQDKLSKTEHNPLQFEASPEYFEARLGDLRTKLADAKQQVELWKEAINYVCEKFEKDL